MARRDVQAQLDLLYRHADIAEALEHKAAHSVSAKLRERIKDLVRWLAQQWVQAFGSLTAPGSPLRLASLLQELRSRLTLLQVDPVNAILTWAQQAAALGAWQASTEAGVKTRPYVVASAASVKAADKARTALADRLQRADRILTHLAGDTHADVMTGVASANSAVHDVERATRWVVNDELNRGTAQVASELDAGMLWVAERDACVHCLAYSGVVAEQGKAFPPDLTFGDRPLKPWPRGVLRHPPLHPHCRCRVTPWFGHIRDLSLADALKREARRSVLKGWSLESESEALRLRAADRLLQRGAGLPRTVEEQARRAVRTGQFKTRSVPTGS